MKHILLLTALSVSWFAGGAWADGEFDPQEARKHLEMLKLEARHHELMSRRHQLEARVSALRAEMLEVELALHGVEQTRRKLGNVRAQPAGGKKRTAARRELVRGAALEKQRDPHAALAAYEKAIELDPRLAEAWARRGNLYRMIGKLEFALKDYEQALRLDPKSWTSWKAYGIVLARTSQKPKALDALRRARSLAPKSAKKRIDDMIVSLSYGR